MAGTSCAAQHIFETRAAGQNSIEYGINDVDMDLDVSGSVGLKNTGKNPAQDGPNKLDTRCRVIQHRVILTRVTISS